MKRETSFKRTLFPPHIIREALETLFTMQAIEKISGRLLSVEVGKDKWTYDSIEQFLADYPRQTGYARAHISYEKQQLILTFSYSNTTIEIEASTHGPINATFSVFERAADACKLPPLPEPPKPIKPPPVVFVGHGRSALWRDLKDHLPRSTVIASKRMKSAHGLAIRSETSWRTCLENLLSPVWF